MVRAKSLMPHLRCEHCRKVLVLTPEYACLYLDELQPYLSVLLIYCGFCCSVQGNIDLYVPVEDLELWRRVARVERICGNSRDRKAFARRQGWRPPAVRPLSARDERRAARFGERLSALDDEELMRILTRPRPTR